MTRGQPKSSFFRKSLHYDDTPVENWGFLWNIDSLTDTYRLRRYLNDDLDEIFRVAFSEYDQLIEDLTVAIDLPLYEA